MQWNTLKSHSPWKIDFLCEILYLVHYYFYAYTRWMWMCVCSPNSSSCIRWVVEQTFWHVRKVKTLPHVNFPANQMNAMEEKKWKRGDGIGANNFFHHLFGMHGMCARDTMRKLVSFFFFDETALLKGKTHNNRTGTALFTIVCLFLWLTCFRVSSFPRTWNKKLCTNSSWFFFCCWMENFELPLNLNRMGCGWVFFILFYREWSSFHCKPRHPPPSYCPNIIDSYWTDCLIPTQLTYT